VNAVDFKAQPKRFSFTHSTVGQKASQTQVGTWLHARCDLASDTK